MEKVRRKQKGYEDVALRLQLYSYFVVGGSGAATVLSHTLSGKCTVPVYY